MTLYNYCRLTRSLYLVALQPVISISTPSGDNTAGGTYTLVCYVAVSQGSTSQPTITWLDNDVQILAPDSSRTVSAITSEDSNVYSSTLTFNPLSASHAGIYTCRATVDGETLTDTDVVTVQSECAIIS